MTFGRGQAARAPHRRRWRWALLALGAGMTAAALGVTAALGDARITARVNAALADALAGEVQVARVHLALPRGVVLEGLTARPPGPAGAAWLALDRAEATLRLAPLLRGTVCLATVRGEGLQIRSPVEADGQVALAAAFASRTPRPTPAPDAPPALPLPVTLGLAEATVQGIDVALALAPGPAGGAAHLHLTHGRLDAHALTLAGQRATGSLRVTCELDGTRQAATGPQRLRLATLAVAAQALDITLPGRASDRLQMSGGTLTVAAPGVTASVSGSGQIAPGAPQATGRARVDVDAGAVGAAEVMALLPAPLAVALGGRATLTAEGSAGDGAATLTLGLRGAGLTLGGAPLSAADLRVGLDQAATTVHQLTVQGGAARLEASGVLGRRPGTAERLAVHARGVPLSAWLSPWADPATLPAAVDLDVDIAGHGATDPATATAAGTVAITARGLGAALAGVPDPVVATATVRLTPAHLQLAPLVVRGDGACAEATAALPRHDGGEVALDLRLVHSTPDRTLGRLGGDVHADRVTLQLSGAGPLRALAADGRLAVTNLAAGGAHADLVLPLRLRAATLSVVGGALRTVAGTVAIDAAVPLPAVDAPHGGGAAGHRDAALRLRAHRLPLATLTPRLGGDLDLDLDLRGTPEAPRARLDLAVSRPAFGGAAATRLTLAARSTGVGELAATLRLDGAQGGQVHGQARLLRRSRGAPVADGELDAALTVARVPLAWLTLAAPPAPPLAGRLDASLRVRGPLRRLAGDGRAAVTDLTWAGTALGTLAATAGGDAQRVGGDAQLAGPIGTATLVGSAWPAEGRVQATLTGHAAVAPLVAVAALPLPLDGALAWQAEVSGPWGAPALLLDLWGNALAAAGAPVGDGSLVAHAEGAGGQYRLTASLAPLLALDAAASLAAGGRPAAGRIAVRVDDLHLAPLYPPLADHGADVVVAATARGTWEEGQLEGEVRLGRLDAHAGSSAVALVAPATLRLDAGGLALTPLALAGPPGHLRLSGTAGATLSLLAEGDVGLAFLGHFVAPIADARGALRWQLAVTGRREAPRPHGFVTLTDPVRLRLRGGLAGGELAIHALDVVLAPERLTLRALDGELGTGRFAARGTVALAALRPAGYDLHLDARDIAVRTADLGLEVNAALTGTGKGTLPQVGGEVEVVRGRFDRAFKLRDFTFVALPHDPGAPPAPAPPDALGDLRLDLHVGTSAPVAVNLDLGAFALKSELAGRVHVTGAALRPRVEGRIGAQGGSLRFPQATLDLDDATVDFVPGSRGELAATVTVAAGGEVTPQAVGSGTPEPVDVALRLDGTLEKMALELTGGGLSRLEILALLATGHVNLAEITGGGGNGLDAALALAGAQISAPLSRLAEEQIERALNLRVDLAAELAQDQIKVVAAKRIGPRLRVEGAYRRGLADDQAQVTTRAEVLLGDRLRLEGGALQGLGDSRPAGSSAAQTSCQLRWRLVGP